ncbi:hypothetical protein ACNR91_000703 [Candidozyma auris]|uniref:Zn(2)-C6 fungal-type domain-containing protein n=2 Tax=Candidozyma auris TaxID=498019 RepID=A0A8F2W2R7_CANAR|nr:hypothetical_protein [[Candida] auris]KNE02271.2 stb4 binds sin3p in two-hybrid assay [[Candida] auris]QEO22033.1 hypothetical_protein [[Candida] auris]QWW24200.1 hypothetical protein CA7LBN_003034 [[Candida] auris]GBL51559.1 hypothetical protein CAJCM15448_38330 [[Candida] auris]
MSDEEKNQGNQQPAKGSQAEAENRPNTQPHSAETPQTFDGLPSMRAYDTAYPPLNQYSSTLLSSSKPIQPLNPRQTSAWSSVPSAATPAPPSSLNHIMVMGGSGSQIPSTGPGLPHNNYSYGMGGRYGTPGASESASGHGYGENNQAPMHASTSTVADTQQGGKNSSGAERARLRVNKACERCRNHKIKCSGVKPCTNCEKHSVECVFRDASQPANPSSSKANAAMSSSSIASNDGQLFNGESSPKKSYEYPPRKKHRPDLSFANFDPGHSLFQAPAPATPDYSSHALPVVQKNYADPSYTAYLENRVHYLENLLSDHSNGHAKNVGTINTDTLDVADLMRHTASKWRSSRRHQNALVIELCKALYEGLDPEAKSKVTVPRTQYFGWNLSGCNYIKPEPLPSMPDLKLLNEATKAHYIDFFFREINPLYAIIHETVFREQIVAYDKQSKASGTQTNVTALFSAMLCLVYALSNRFVQFMKPDGPSMEMLRLEERLFKYSHKVMSIFSFEWESFELIQCWMLATLYLRITHRQTSANQAFGNAVSMCRSMGLFRDRKLTADVSSYDLLKAKRVFFSLYCFDRVIFLQAGRYRALNEFDIVRPFPSFDYVKESAGDDWITLPAFAMIHIARVANFLHTNSSDNYDLLKSQQINKEIYLLQGWLAENGFDDVHDIFPYEGCGGPVSHMVKAVVKLHFYDLLLAIHGKLLFSYFGKRIASEGMQIERVVEANEGVIFLLNKLKNADCLYAPWYLNLLVLFNVGINCLVFINAGVYLVESRRLMKESMNLLKTFQNSAVRNEKGKLIFHERFKMVKECIWVFKMTNKIMSLSFQKSLADFEQFGTDPGPDEVNQQYFTQFGLMKQKKKDDLEKLMEDQSKRDFTERTKNINDETSPGVVASQPASDAFGNDNFLSNLQWFDQWLDFNQDM